jgi:integrase
VPDYRIVKHRGNYSLAYTDADRGRIRLALGTADRGLAEARARELWRARSKPPSERLADIWAAYVAEKAKDGIETDPSGSTWKALEPSFGHMLATELTREDCRQHTKRRRKLGRSDSTIRKELEMMRAALRHWYGSAAPAVWMPPPAKPRDHFLTRQELGKLLEHIETPHVRLFVVLAVTTGARMSALLELTWDRVDLDRGVIDLNPAGRHQTNKRRAVVPIAARADAELRPALDASMSDHVIEYAGGPVKSVKKALQAASKRSGVKASAHVFRHTAGVWMAEADVPMQKIAQYLGHTSTRVTETVYARYSPSFMRDASAALDW